MTRLALVLDRASEDRLLADIVESGHAVVARLVSAHEALERIGGLDAEVLLVGAGRATLTAELLRAADVRGIRLVALASDELGRRHAREIGLLDVADERASWREIEPLLAGAVPVPQPAPERAAHGRVVAVWGPAGAPGRTTLAVNAAAELAARDRRVALVDADVYGGAVAPLLCLVDEAPGFASACRLAASGSLDRAELERIAQHYPAPSAPFQVLTGLAGPRRWPELSAERVEATLDVLRTRFDDVVVDVGFSLERDEEVTSDLFAPRRNAATLTIIAAADRVVAVGLADPVGLPRFLRAHVELGELVPPDRIEVVANRVRSSALGLDPADQVRRALDRIGGIGRASLLPDDPRATDSAMLGGRTLREVAPRSPLSTAIRAFVDTRLLPEQRALRASRRPRPLRERARARLSADYSGERVDAQ